MQNLSAGSTGQDVKNIQLSLNCHQPTELPPLDPDGIFGPKTSARVKEFQSGHGLAADGIVGPKTRAALSGDDIPISSSGCNCCNGENATTAQAAEIAALFQSSQPQARQNQMGFVSAGIGSAASSFVAGMFRPLDASQQAAAVGVYGASLDFSTIYISEKKGIGGRPFAVAVPWEGSVVQIINCGTFSPPYPTLIHELGHVWQSQHHSNKYHFVPNAVKSQADAIAANLKEVLSDPIITLNKKFPTFYPFDAYAYDPSTPFSSLAAEQMAQAIRNGEAAIVAHVRSVGMNAVDPACVAGLSSPRFADHRLPGVK